MNHLTFIKFGGSVITDKSGQETPDVSVIQHLAQELQRARTAQPDHTYLLGHGSGSFGHLYAARYHIHTGLSDDEDWIGYALTSAAALRLNRIVVDALIAAGVPALTLQPSASAWAHTGTMTTWHTDTIMQALHRKLVPVVYGDVAFDTAQGSCILSTEALLSYLALQTDLRPTRIIMVGEDAVYTGDPRVEPEAQLIPRINAANIDTILGTHAGASHGTDVTGGMHGKIKAMWNLVQALPSLEISLIAGTPGVLYNALIGKPITDGTTISAD